MTLEELREMPAGVIDTRSFILNADGIETEEFYCIGKTKDGKYFIGFSDDGSYCSTFIREKDMLRYIDDKHSTDSTACDIYFTDPHLSFWMD